MRGRFPLLVLFFIGFVSGSIRLPDTNSDPVALFGHDSEPKNEDSRELPSELQRIIGFGANSKTGRHVFHSNNRRGLGLVGSVEDLYGRRNVEKPLKPQSLPKLEKSFVKDIIRVIMKNEEYMRFLNNPSFLDLVHLVRGMLKDPMQQVLKKELKSKITGIRSWYDRLYKTFTDLETQEEAMELINRLREASEKHELTVADTVELKENMRMFAFLLQNQEFREAMEGLEESLEKNYKKNSTSTEAIATTTTTMEELLTDSVETTTMSVLDITGSIIGSSEAKNQTLTTTTSPSETTVTTTEAPPLIDASDDVINNNGTGNATDYMEEDLGADY